MTPCLFSATHWYMPASESASAGTDSTPSSTVILSCERERMKESNYGSRFKGGFAQAALTELTEQSITAGGSGRNEPEHKILFWLFSASCRISRCPAFRLRKNGNFFFFSRRGNLTRSKRPSFVQLTREGFCAFWCPTCSVFHGRLSSLCANLAEHETPGVNNEKQPPTPFG